MLSDQHFYHRTIRRNVISFGSLFKHLQLVRYSKDSFVEIDRITVPLSYSEKETFIKRLYSNPDLHKQVQIVLPRMSFSMTGLEYDPTRKLSSFLNSFHKSNDNTGVNKQYVGVPYNLSFELNIYVRNVEDGTQIVEQILPYFNPDYTLSMDFVDGMGIKKDIPIILESIEENTSSSGTEETVRIINWTLRFKMKTYFFGPISSGKLIRETITNISTYAGTNNDIQLYLDNGFGDYKVGEYVYQGLNLPDANNSGIVKTWDNANRILSITDVNGTFAASSNIKGSITNASHNVIQVISSTQLQARIVVSPIPVTANLGDDFGYSTGLAEFPFDPESDTTLYSVDTTYLSSDLK